MYNVYKIVNSINDKVYIGRTIHTLNYRWKGHLKCLERGDMRHLYCAMRKYGVENFRIELIEECTSYTEMVEKEVYYCDKYNAYSNGYNMTTAGEVNPMECQKSKDSHDRKMRTPTVRNKISASMRDLRAKSDKKILIHLGKVGKRVSEKELPNYLEKGWKIGSNTVGKIRIYRSSDLRENSVWDFELQHYLDNGWILGGKPNRISDEQRQALNQSHYKKVYAITADNNQSPIFDNLKDACEWWYGYLTSNRYDIINRAHKYHYALADIIKKSNKQNSYIYLSLIHI